jgi:hypothetical protein
LFRPRQPADAAPPAFYCRSVMLGH